MENKAWQIREFKNLFKFSSLITRSFEINSIKNTKKKKKEYFSFVFAIEVDSFHWRKSISIQSQEVDRIRNVTNVREFTISKGFL